MRNCKKLYICQNFMLQVTKSMTYKYHLRIGLESKPKKNEIDNQNYWFKSESWYTINYLMTKPDSYLMLHALRLRSVLCGGQNVDELNLIWHLGVCQSNCILVRPRLIRCWRRVQGLVLYLHPHPPLDFLNTQNGEAFFDQMLYKMMVLPNTT